MVDRLPCTQNLASGKDEPGVPSLESVASLFRTVGEFFISDISSKATGTTNPEAYFFEAFIFGYCPATKQFKAFAIAPNLKGPKFRMLMASMVIKPGVYHPMGSGEKSFVELDKELANSHPNPGVIVTLREMLKREKSPRIGGHFQVGVTNKEGFSLRPILNLAEGTLNRKVTFLGWDVDSIGQLDGYRIGYQAFSPDVD